MKLEPLQNYNEPRLDGRKLQLFLNDAQEIFKSFNYEFDEYQFPKSKEQQIKSLLEILDNYAIIIGNRLERYWDPEYNFRKTKRLSERSLLRFKRHIKNHGLSGSELELKLALAQDARDELVFADRVLHGSKRHFDGLFYTEPIISQRSTSERDLKLAELESILEEAKQKKGINWFKVAIGILKSIFGFFGLGKAVDELFDLLNAIFSDIPLKHKIS